MRTLGLSEQRHPDQGIIMNRRTAHSILCCLLVLACTEPRIDTSTDDRMKASVAEVRASLPEATRSQFDSALQMLAFSEVSLGSILAEGATPGALLGKMKDQLEGKSAADVIATADSIRTAHEAKERDQALQEIRELEEQKGKADQARQDLAKFVVVRSRFYTRRDALDMTEPVIELTVRNGTSHPISRAYLMGTLATPGRSVPWLKDSFNYRIRGGLEPGEQASWTLSPGMFSDWSRAHAPGDAVLTVEVVRLDGPDDKPLFSTMDFTDEDAARLARLRAKLAPR